MHSDVELLEKLPVASSAKSAVLDLVETNARSLLEQRTYEIDKSGLAVAIAGAIGFGYLGFWLWTLGTWWSWIAFAITAVVWLVFFFGIFESAQKKDRAAIAAEKARVKAEKKASGKAGS